MTALLNKWYGQNSMIPSIYRLCNGDSLEKIMYFIFSFFFQRSTSSYPDKNLATC